MSSSIKVGIIGCGVISHTHIKCFQSIEGVEVALLCDLVEEKAKERAEKYGIGEICTDYKEMLKNPDIDCISICTDHASHSPIAVDALNAGKHVLCEKALAASKEGLDAMMEAHVANCKLVFSGIFQHRFDRINRKVKKLLDAGTFGRVLTAGIQHRCLRTHDYYSADKWRGTWESEGGAVLINQAIHVIDLLNWITGGVASLTGAYSNLTHEDVMETEDTAVASLKFKNGSLGTIEATCSSHLDWEHTIFIHGSLGSVEIRNDKPIKVLFGDKELQKKVEADLSGTGKADAVQEGKGYYGGGHQAQIFDFVEAIREGREPFVTAQSARKTVDLILAVYEAYNTRSWVELD